MNTQTKIKTIMKLLDKAYGRLRFYPRSNPVDELIRTVLSQNTSDHNSLAAFAVLKKHFRSWSKVLTIDTRRIAKLIKHAGLENIKAKRIKEILAEIKRREGAVTLAHLKSMEVAAAQIYLMSLKGVGPKTAACILLFSFHKPVMPVDTHIFRVSGRLGLICSKLSIEEAHRALTKLIPKNLIYSFHLGIIQHGRRTCRAQNPRCGFCVLYHICTFKGKRLYKRKAQ